MSSRPDSTATVLGDCTVVLPAKNEARSLANLLPELTQIVPGERVLVVDDGSDDDTVEVCGRCGVRVVSHPYSKGNGAAIKTGIRNVQTRYVVFMDADGQHRPADIANLVAPLERGYDLAVGARTASAQASLGRLFANSVYNRFAAFMVNRRVEDLTSGMRAARADRFREFLHLYPNGFSNPTTSTMAFFRSGYSVTYVPIDVRRRIGKSHIQPIKDGVRFFLILFKIGSLYSPLKIFAPFSFATFAAGIGYYIYTYIDAGRFTNMSALLFSVSVLIFLIGLVSEQITMILYQRSED